MDDEIRRLRAEARRLARGKHPSQVRYPDRFRRAAVALVRRRLGPEASVECLARALGVSEPVNLPRVEHGRRSPKRCQGTLNLFGKGTNAGGTIPPIEKLPHALVASDLPTQRLPGKRNPFILSPR
jgi:hypothetical protein